MTEEQEFEMLQNQEQEFEMLQKQYQKMKQKISEYQEGKLIITEQNIILATKVKRAEQPKVKSINGIPFILRGIVESITSISSKYSFVWRIKMNGYNYYLNSTIEKTAENIFTVGKGAAFTVQEKANIKNPNKPYLVIAQIFYTF